MGNRIQKPELPRILIVDDKPVNLIALEATLKSPDIEIIKAESGNEALTLLLELDVALILLDVQMPVMDGFETAELIRLNSRTSHIPIIFVSAINKDEKHLFKGYESGAVDYLFKPINNTILKSKITVFLNLYKQKKELEILSSELGAALKDAEEARRIIEDKNRELSNYAIRDGLTGLYNHRHMHEVLETEFKRARRYNTDLSCILVDLDFFKEINDSLGHPFGDFVLKYFSKLLRDHIRESDYIFRYGGEEFMVLLPQTDIDGARLTAEKFRQTIETTTFREEDHTTSLTVSIGVASYYYNHPDTPKDIISFSDKALFTAKAEGRNRVVVFREPEYAFPKNSGKNALRHMKENLNAILVKTKKASISSLELLVRDSGHASTAKHNKLVQEYISMLGYHLNLPPAVIDTFKQTTTIHDCFQELLGKNIINNPGKLSRSEMDQVRSLPYILAELTEQFDFFANERSVLLTHHENYDGSGYPEGLKQDQIPLGARIFSIADSFVAMILDRPHRPRKTISDAVLELADNAGTQFDPDLVEEFFTVLEKNEPNKISPRIFDRAREILDQKRHAGNNTTPGK